MRKTRIYSVFLFLLCVGLSLSSRAQEKKITGTISDEKGEPLSGATILVKNTSVSTTTSNNGSFTLSVPAGGKTLVVSYVGMETQEQAIGNKTHIRLSLKSTASTLSDVVIIGYGSVRKTDLTGAVQRISREDLLKDAPVNALQALQGKIAGVTVTQNDGAPGAGLSIRVRGSNSFLGGTEPLYVIDGVPYNNSSSGTTPLSIGDDEKQTLNALSFINPNDIESIDILRDASATAIYGSRGANGVVLITTRKGRSGKDRVEFNLTVGMAEVSKILDVLSPSEYAAYQNLAYRNSNRYTGTNYSIPYPGDSLPDPQNPGKKYYAKGPQDYEGNDKSWQREIFRRALYQNYSVNISGGGEAGSHSLSFNYLDQDGTIMNSGYQRFGLSVNLNRNISRIFKAGTSTSVTYSITDGVKTGTDKSDAASAGIIRSAITFPSTADDPQPYDGVGDAFITNPYIYVNDVLNKVKGINIFSSNFVEANISRSLKFRQNVGFNYASSSRDQYYPRTVYEGFAVKGWGLKADNVWNSIVSESILSFNKKIKRHDFNVMGAATFERTNGQSKRTEAKTFPNDLLQNENMASAEVVLPIVTNRYQSTLISFLGRVNYTYNDRYLLTFSYRQDGSSKFGKDNKWAGFSSAAIAWKVSNEKFMRSIKAISDLKIRFSYGQTGNQGIGSYASLAKLSVYNYPFNGTLQTGLANDLYSGPPNEKLKWETTTSYNLGLDLGLFKNRITLHVDAYKKKTDNLLQNVITPPSSGFQTQLRNAGSIENKGLEITLGAAVIRSAKFEWNTNFNIAFNRNKILSLGPGVLEQYARNISTGDAPFIQIAGQPIGALYGFLEDGYYDNEAEVREDPQYTNQSNDIIRRMVGEVKYRNLDKDPTSISNSDRTYIGNVNPDYTFGFTNNFKYKRFDLSIFINGVQGNDIINMNTRFNSNLGTNKNITQEMADGAWVEGADNSNATGPKIMRQFFRNMLFSRRFIEDGSFVRIKNITLGYNVPVKMKGLSALRVAIGVNNLYTFTKYTGYDPEINSYGDNPALFGVDLGGYPNSRTYNLSLRCNF